MRLLYIYEIGIHHFYTFEHRMIQMTTYEDTVQLTRPNDVLRKLYVSLVFLN